VLPGIFSSRTLLMTGHLEYASRSPWISIAS